MKHLPDITVEQFDPKVLAEDVRKEIIIRVKSSAPEMSKKILVNAVRITAHKGLAVFYDLIKGYENPFTIAKNHISLFLKNVATAPGSAIKYWRVLYYGRRAGRKPPPYTAIHAWGVKAKGWSTDYTGRQRAWQKAQAIGKYGTQPRKPVFEEIKTFNTKDVVEIMRRKIISG